MLCSHGRNFSGKNLITKRKDENPIKKIQTMEKLLKCLVFLFVFCLLLLLLFLWKESYLILIFIAHFFFGNKIES